MLTRAQAAPYRAGQSHVHKVEVWESGYIDVMDEGELERGSCLVDAPGAAAMPWTGSPCQIQREAEAEGEAEQRQRQRNPYTHARIHTYTHTHTHIHTSTHKHTPGNHVPASLCNSCNFCCGSASMHVSRSSLIWSCLPLSACLCAGSGQSHVPGMPRLLDGTRLKA